MADFQTGALQVFAVLMMINLGILVVDLSCIDGLYILDDSCQNYTGLNQNLSTDTNHLLWGVNNAIPTDDNGNSCPSWLPCRTYAQGLSGTAGYSFDVLTGLLGVLTGIGSFIFGYISTIFLGFPLLMAKLAAMVAPNNVAIKLLFGGVAAIPIMIGIIALFKYIFDFLRAGRE